MKKKCKKKIKNFSFKSRIKTIIKKLYINLNDLNFVNFIYYYKLFVKYINILSNKKIFKKNKTSRIKKNIVLYIKNKLFF